LVADKALRTRKKRIAEKGIFPSRGRQSAKKFALAVFGEVTVGLFLHPVLRLRC
jgi:hypothetical protein